MEGASTTRRIGTGCESTRSYARRFEQVLRRSFLLNLGYYNLDKAVSIGRMTAVGETAMKIREPHVFHSQMADGGIDPSLPSEGQISFYPPPP
jgi:hypothetical protein